jgi:nitroimidazol reductase NimA-like FMN-containing flavoprotein (pyridoxamine 5'-phosphate oxidase superfamily)
VPDARPDSKAQLTELERDECLRLLSLTTLGRLAVLPEDWKGPPVIRPVSYVFDPSSQSIIFRSARGSKLTALLLAGTAAFEIDGIDPSSESGWSVIVHGPIEEIENASEIERLGQVEPPLLAPGATPHWIRIRATIVSGRRIALQSPRASAETEPTGHADEPPSSSKPI